MRNSSKLLLAALASMLILAFGASSASATRLEAGAPGTITNEGRLTFEEGGEGPRVICDVTKLLTVHRTIPKTEGALVGYVREVRIAEPCREGNAWILDRNNIRTRAGAVEWHITYRGFSGTLPRITLVRILLKASFLIEAIVRCLYRGTRIENEPLGNLREAGGGSALNRLLVEESVSIPLFRELSIGGFCPSSGRLSGTLTISPAITLRLI